MFSKVAAVIVLLAVAHCQEHSHSFSLKSIVKHEPTKIETHHSIPVHTVSYNAVPVHGIHSDSHGHGHAVSSQSIIRHDTHESHGDAHYVVPVHHEDAHETYTIQSAPIHEVHSGGQSHGHAVSSQSIIRHDSGHHESHDDGHYVVPVHHEAITIQAAPIHEVHSSGHSQHGHAVSSQSIIRHDSGHQESHDDGHYIVPVQHEAAYKTINIESANSGAQSHGHAVSSQSIIRHDSGHQESHDDGHYIVPVQHEAAHKTITIQSAPVHSIHSGAQSHGHAVSSQSIIRHDSGKHESHDDGHYIIPTYNQAAHETVSIQSAPIYESHSSEHSGHAVSSQSIVRHDNGHKEQSYGGSHYVVAAPVQTVSLHAAPALSGSHIQSHGHAVSSQNIVRHESGHQDQTHGATQYFIRAHQEPAPVHETLNVHAAPVQLYASGQSYGHGHGHAVSSQNIIRHDNHQSHGSEHHIIPVQHQYAPAHQTVSIHAAPIQHHIVQEFGHYEESHDEEYYAHPKYEFEYKVEDPHTGDNKYQHEARDGDVVKGVYSLHEADGSIRTVKYAADKHSGFNAHVSNSGVSKHVEEQSNYHH